MNLKLKKNLLNVVFFANVVFAVLLSVQTFFAQQSAQGVDLTFNPVFSKEAGTNISAGFQLQPDGKMIVFGNFQIINGVPKLRIARLNQDGTLDNSFDCKPDVCNFGISSALVQPDDGKILVGGTSLTQVGNVTRLIRLNPDGSQDGSFNFGVNTGGGSFSCGAGALAVQPDGKIFASVSCGGFQLSSTTLYRLNPDGSRDNSFASITFDGRGNRDFLVGLVVQPDGKILVASKRDQGFIFRLNQDGTRDSSFDAQALGCSNCGFQQLPGVSSFGVQPDGKIPFIGQFDSVNGLARSGFARLNQNGTLDLNFNPAASGTSLTVLPDGKILLAGSSGFSRLNADGSLDNAFTSPIFAEVPFYRTDAQGRIFFYGRLAGEQLLRLGRLNSNGTLDSSFNTPSLGVVGAITAGVLQADGKIVVTGDFTSVNGVASANIARLNPDGTRDAFNAGIGFNAVPSKLLVQPDGKIIALGSFTTYNGVSRPNLLRLNPDGSLDTGFNFTSGTANAVAVLPDGKLLVGGGTFAENGVARTGVARLNPNGSLDTSFNAFFSSPAVRTIFVQPDGKIIAGGAFTSVGGTNRRNLARLNADGSVDQSFDAGSNVAQVFIVKQQSDGKYIVYTYDGSTPDIFRLNNDGTVDSTFQRATFPSGSGFTIISDFLLQPDGTTIVVGGFNTVNNVTRNYIARLKSNGTLDATYLPSGADARINVALRQSDGKIVVGGEFTTIGNVVRPSLARISAQAFVSRTLFDFDGDGRADYAVFRPSNSTWYLLNSSNNAFSSVQLGQNGDRIAPADYDGDGKTDLAVFRPAGQGDPNRAFFYILQNSTNVVRAEQFGRQGDVPVTGDWDGDGRADVAVYRDGSQSGGQSYFFYRPSSQPAIDYRSIAWGATGDKPVLGDFDGDGKLDAAIFRPSIARWYILRSTNNQVIQLQYGVSTDIPAAADYDGDGITNIAVYRPSTGTWYTSLNPATNYGAVQWGVSTDLPIPADYDGDGRADVAVFRPENGAWYVLRSTSGFTGFQWGTIGDKPAPNAYVP